jgi:hypothetical protein
MQFEGLTLRPLIYLGSVKETEVWKVLKYTGTSIRLASIIPKSKSENFLFL